MSFDADSTLQAVLDMLRLAFERERPAATEVGMVPFADWSPQVVLDDVGEAEFGFAARAASRSLVRQIAIHPGLPSVLVLQLVDHPDWEVRGQAAARLVDIDVLHRLLNDPEPKVRGCLALRNRLIGEGDLRRLADDHRYEVRCCVAADPRTPHDVLWKLVDDRSSTVRWNLLFGPHNGDIELVAHLTNDPDPTNASQARGLLHQYEYQRAHTHPIGTTSTACPAC